MFEYFVYGHIAAAILTTIVVLRLDYFERPQAIAQISLAWIVPFLGAFFILVFQTAVHRNMTTKAEPDSEDHYRDEGAASDLYTDLQSND